MKFSKSSWQIFTWLLMTSIVLFSVESIAQSSIIAGSADETTLRDLQLLGRFKNYSFTTRPVFINENDTINKFLINNQTNAIINKKLIRVYSSPLIVQQQYNNNSPWGRNNTPMLLVKGYQQEIKSVKT